MLKKRIKFLSLGDIHLGNPSNKTAYIIESFKIFFKTNHAILKELDYIFVNGDLFDRLLLANSLEFNMVTIWVLNLIEYCKVHDIGLRFLEGTPSHDNEQFKTIFDTIIKTNPNFDIKYFRDIDIEYIEEFGINILYVPDKNDKPANERYKIILKLMKEKKLDKVDFAMMHGNFKYQLPFHSNSTHDEDDYLSIVRYYININHIHTPSAYGRILAPGSFDRMAHGEEEDKGALYIEVENEDKMYFNFLKNENARIQKTFYVTDKDKEKALTKLHKELEKLPYTAFVRIFSKHKLNISKQIKEIYNFYSVKEEVKGEVTVNTSNIFKIENDIEELSITKDNVIDLINKETILTEQEKSILEISITELNKKWKL